MNGARPIFEQQESAITWPVVDDRIVDEVEFIFIPFVAFDTKRDEVSVGGVGALLDDVPDDVGNTTAR